MIQTDFIFAHDEITSKRDKNYRPKIYSIVLLVTYELKIKIGEGIYFVNKWTDFYKRNS